MCEACTQPRIGPGSHPTRLQPGEHQYRGYGEWVVHPDEAHFILERGFALVNGEPQRATFSHNEAYVTRLRIEGTDTEARPADRYVPVVGW